MRKRLLAVAFLVASIHSPFGLTAQERGVSPLSAEASAKAVGTTYAIVIGISDYQDDAIPDLKYAHRDAEAFANFLRSPAGGALDNDHLKVLINEQATQGQFGAALDWLWEVAGEHDRAIIYFSGHGDVERKSITNPGYLLCWDAPARVYMSGGAFDVRSLNDVVSTLALQNKAKVLLITDACHAGKLAGSDINGTQITSQNLAKQFENVIKVLSCQPNEYSIEGEQWGGGRGAFSYHLLDGLYGLADRNADKAVNLMELRGYMEEKVTAEVAPESQLPMVVGDGREKLADVFPDILAQITEGKKGQLQLFNATESRGIEDEVLAVADSNVVAMYLAFKQCLVDKNFLCDSAERCADYYYEKLREEPQLEKLHSGMRRNYAAALQDDAQQVLNEMIKTGLNEYITARKAIRPKYKNYPLYLSRAAELLGADHYMYPVLQARKLYFEAFALNSRYKSIPLCREALKWQPDMPHAYHFISKFQRDIDSVQYYAQKAMELAPNWVLPYCRVAAKYRQIEKNFEQSANWLRKAEAIDSSAFVYYNWARHYRDAGNEVEREKMLLKALSKLDANACFPLIHNELGLIYLHNNGPFDLAAYHFSRALEMDSTFASAYLNLGNVYGSTQQYDKAEEQFLKAIQVDSSLTNAYNNLGNVYMDTRQFDLAEELYKKIIQLDSTNTSAYNNLGIVYAETRRFDLAEEQYKKAIQIDSSGAIAYYNLSCLRSLQNQPDKAFNYLDQALMHGYNAYDWIQQDPDLAPLRAQEERWDVLMKKYIPK
ncbi:MAG: tetratricopeptide repeat protein [Saprospiraceae bacterium]|nr:tetratricopeptide repeat protein [Saprospiraceae bacterium]